MTSFLPSRMATAFTSSLVAAVAMLAPLAPALANTVARSDAQCRLSENGRVVFDGDCNVKQKSDVGATGFVVRLENGDTYRFLGKNNQSLRLRGEDGSGSNVLFEDKGPRGVFTWNDGQSTRRLMVNTGEGSGSPSGGTSGSRENEQAKINARIETWGRNCKNAIIEKYGSSRMSMADVDVTLGATLKQRIDAGQITLADINKSGLSYNFTARHAKGKDPVGICSTDGEGSVTRLEAGNR